MTPYGTLHYFVTFSLVSFLPMKLYIIYGIDI